MIGRGGNCSVKRGKIFPHPMTSPPPATQLSSTTARPGGTLTRLAPVLAGSFFISTAHAQTTMQLESNFSRGDMATFYMESAWAGVLTYDNDGAQSSQSGDWTITDSGVTCHINVRFGGPDVNGAEVVTIRCDGPYEPHVSTRAILDGDVFDFHILYLGG